MDEEENLLGTTHVRDFDEDSEDLNDDQEAALLADSDFEETDGNMEQLRNDGDEETINAGNDVTEDDDVLDIQVDEEVDFDKTAENIIQKRASSESDDEGDDGEAKRRGRFLTERKADDLTLTTKVVKDIPESLESVPLTGIPKFSKPNHNINAPNQRRFGPNDYQRNNRPNLHQNRNERRFSPPAQAKFRNQPNHTNIHVNPKFSNNHQHRAGNIHWESEAVKKNYNLFPRNNSNYPPNQNNPNVNPCQRNLIDVPQAENQHLRPMGHQNPQLIHQNAVVPSNNAGYQQMNVNHPSLLPGNMNTNNHLQFQNQGGFNQPFMQHNSMVNQSVPSTMQNQPNMNYMPRGIGSVNNHPQSLLGTPNCWMEHGANQHSMGFQNQQQQTSFQPPYQPFKQQHQQHQQQQQQPNMQSLMRQQGMPVPRLMENPLPFSGHNVQQIPYAATNQMPLNNNQNQNKFAGNPAGSFVPNFPPPIIHPMRHQNAPINANQKWPQYDKPAAMHNFVNRGMVPETKIVRQKTQVYSNALTIIQTVSHEQLQQQGHIGNQNNEVNLNRAKRQMPMPFAQAKQQRMEKPMPVHVMQNQSNIKEVPLVGFLPAVKPVSSVIPAITELSQNKSTLPKEDEEDEQTKVLRKQIEEQKQKRERILKEKEENRRKAAEERRKALQLNQKTEDCSIPNANIGVSTIANIVPNSINKSPRPPPPSASLIGSNLINYASAPQPRPQNAVRMQTFAAPTAMAQQLSGHPVKMKALMPNRINMQFQPRPAHPQGLMTPTALGQPNVQTNLMENRNGVVLIENLAADTTQVKIHQLCTVGTVQDVQYQQNQRSAKVTFYKYADAENFTKRYHSWDTRELELFDLVEEVNGNFYEILGLQQEATVIDIRKAYRRLSLQLHPDKNKDKNAEEKFRQLVAIYEVLKDLEKRRIYDNILLNGLPTWKQPVYYYRHVRKMSLLELAIFLFLLATGAQYLFAWSVYIEKKYELEDILSAKFKKKEKKLRKFKNFEDFSTDAIMAEIDLLPKPKYQDLLPFKLCDYLIYFIKSTPGCYQKWRDLWMQVRLDDDVSEQDDADYETEERIKKPRRKKIFEIPEMTGEYLEPTEHPPITDTRTEQPRVEPRAADPATWTDEQLVVLIRAINKYPGGVANRWEKIAHFVGRPVLEVVTAAKQLKSNTLDSGVSMSTSVQGITGTLNEHVEVKKKKKGALSEEMLERQMKLDNWREHSPRGVAKEEHKVVVDANVSSGVWNQKQQKALESALAAFAKGSGERWENIAGCVPGKTKDECMVRYKELAEVVRKKRQLVAR